jgi:hypothetical protein
MALIAAALMLAPAAAAEDIDAGPIWSNIDAQTKCPGVCASAGGSWNGNWVTVAPGQSSVCKCDIKRGGGATDYDAGPIWNDADARTKCPAVCTSHKRSWNGNWRTTVVGQMSTCSCGR